MNLADIDTTQFSAVLRRALIANYPRHHELDYAALFNQCSRRAGEVYLTQFVPEIGRERSVRFERMLAKINMRAAVSIPRPMAMGYALGAACHALAGGRAEDRHEAASGSAMGMFLIGYFDELFDHYPEELGELGTMLTEEAMIRWAAHQQLDDMVHDPEKVLAAGFLDLYRVYLKRCHALADRSDKPGVAGMWVDALIEMHQAEADSVRYRMTGTPPGQEMITLADMPRKTAFWAMALGACLGMDEQAISAMSPFVRDYANLVAEVDGAVNVAVDIRKQVWSGFAAKLALNAHNQKDADRILDDTVNECVSLLVSIPESLDSCYWQAGDAFSLKDILWAYVWTWSGGEVSRA